MSTYLQLCQEVANELGIAGGVGTNPTAVTGQIGQMARIAQWVKAANAQTNNRFLDWNFLWGKTSGLTLTATSAVIPLPGGTITVRIFDRESFYLSYGLSTHKRLRYIPWQKYRDTYSGVLKTRKPSSFTVLPNNTLLMDSKADTNHTVVYEYWKRPTALAANADLPDMPQEFQRIIICRAKVLYGEYMNDAYIKDSAAAEHDEILERMEASEAPDRREEGMAAAGPDFQDEII